MKTAKLTKITAVKGGKFEVEISQAVGRTTNLLALMNQGDDRFSQEKERKAWLTSEASMIKKYFGLDVSNLKEGQSIEVDMFNPSVEGLPLSIQISETITPNAYQAANKLKSAKQYVNKTTGETVYLLKDGAFIYSNSTVVCGEANHSFVQHNSTKLESEVRVNAAEAKAAEPIVA